MHGKRVQVVYKQHYMESPSSDVARPLPGLATSSVRRDATSGSHRSVWLQVGDVENPQGAQIHQSGQGDSREISNHSSTLFESAGRPSNFFWGPQQGNKLILWES
jgi:hypothetical protein